MAILRIRVQATDETDDALNDVERNWDQASERIGGNFSTAMLAAAAVVGVALNEIVDQMNAASEGARDLIAQLGTLTEEGRAAQAGIISALGVDASIAAQGVAVAGGLGIDAEQGGRIAADLINRGVTQDDLVRSAQTAGVGSVQEFSNFAAAGTAAAAGAGVTAGEFFGEFRDSGTTFRSFGLNPFQSLALQQQAYESGTVSEVQSFFEQLLTTATESGVEPGRFAQGVLGSVAGGTRQEGLELLGEFGGENLLDAIRDGTLDLSNLGIQVPEGLVVPGSTVLSGEEEVRARAEGIALDPNASFADRAFGFASSIPGFSGVVGTTAGAGQVFGIGGREAQFVDSGTFGGGGFQGYTPAQIEAITGGTTFGPPTAADLPEATTTTDSDRITQIQNEIRSLQTAITRERSRFENPPPGFVYDAEKAAAANSALTRRLGLLTGELGDLLGQ